MNSWITEEKKLSIIDFLHALWCKNIELRFRRLQEVQKYDLAALLTKHSAKLFDQSMQFSNHQLVRFADPHHASTLSYLCKWHVKSCFQGLSQRLLTASTKANNISRYAVDFLARTCCCSRSQHDHAVSVIQGYHDPADGLHRSVRDFVAYNLTILAFRATYAAPMPLVEILGLQPPAMTCSAELLSLESHKGAFKLPVLLLESREHELLCC